MPRRGENIRKRKDSRWEGRFIKLYDSAGKAKYGSVYGKTYFEAKRKLSEITKQLSMSVLPVRDHEINFREALFLWLKSNRIKLKDQTYAKYLHLIENHLIPSLGSIQVKKLESTLINKFLNEKSNNGRLDGKGGLAPSYIQTLGFIINSTIEYAIKGGYRRQMNGDIVRPGKKNKKNELKVLSTREQSILERYVFAEPDEKKLGVLLSLYTGLRIGEVCGLSWEDIDLDANTLHIRHTVERIANVDAIVGERKTKLVLGNAKTLSSNRIIPIPSNILPIIKSCKRSSGFVIQGNAYEYTDPRTYDRLSDNPFGAGHKRRLGDSSCIKGKRGTRAKL